MASSNQSELIVYFTTQGDIFDQEALWNTNRQSNFNIKDTGRRGVEG